MAVSGDYPVSPPPDEESNFDFVKTPLPRGDNVYIPGTTTLDNLVPAPTHAAVENDYSTLDEMGIQPRLKVDNNMNESMNGPHVKGNLC